jgi:hypothetical protein
MDPAWVNGQKGNFSFPISKTISSWSVAVTFDKKVDQLYVYTGTNVTCSSGGTGCSFSDAVIFYLM